MGDSGRSWSRNWSNCSPVRISAGGSLCGHWSVDMVPAIRCARGRLTRSACFALDLRGQLLQINLLAGRRELVLQQVPILGEAHTAAGRDGLARSMGLEFASRYLL